MIAHYTTDRPRSNAERTASWRTQWARLPMSEAEREAIAREGMAAKDRIVAHMRARERMARVPAKHWQRVAAGLAHALAGAEPLLARRVVPIRRMRG